MIQTAYELHGRFSTSNEGQQFMVDLAEETNSNLTSIGKSFNGNDLYCMKFGSGEDVVLFTAGIHRSEPASREMLMMKTRDIAYNADGKYSDLLESYTIYSIPTMNPDSNGRPNAQDLNINRDIYALETPEMTALMKFINQIRPEMYVDFHERGGPAQNRVEFVNPWKMDVNVHDEIAALSQNNEEFIKSKLSSFGIDNGDYPRSIIGPIMSVAAGMNIGIISFTPETFESEIPDTRIYALSIVLEAALEWFDKNINEIRKLNQSFETPINIGDAFYLYNGDNEYYQNATLEKISIPVGYQLESVDSFRKWIDVYDIEVDEVGFVPISQRAGRILPYLLDSASDMKVAAAIRVEPERRKDGRHTKVLYEEWVEVFIKNYLSRL